MNNDKFNDMLLLATAKSALMDGRKKDWDHTVYLLDLFEGAKERLQARKDNDNE